MDEISGGSGGGFDMVMCFQNTNEHIVYGTFEHIVDMIKAGKWPMIACTADYVVQEDSDGKNYYYGNINLATDVNYFEARNELNLCCVKDEGIYATIKADGTISVQRYD